MGAKGLYNSEHLRQWRERGGSVEKAELHARLMTALMLKKDKLTSRQLNQLCATLIPGSYERAVALLTTVSETATAEELRAALTMIERAGEKRRQS